MRRVVSVAVGRHAGNMILLWPGSVETIPAGFLLCDGTHGTPDLRDRFIQGTIDALTTGERIVGFPREGSGLPWRSLCYIQGSFDIPGGSMCLLWTPDPYAPGAIPDGFVLCDGREMGFYSAPNMEELYVVGAGGMFEEHEIGDIGYVADAADYEGYRLCWLIRIQGD